MKRRLKRYQHIASVLLFLISAIALYGSLAFGAELSVAQKEVWKLENTYFERWKNGDMKGLTELHLKDAIIWGNKSAWPKDRSVFDMGGVAGDGIGPLLDSYELESHEIKLIGNIAVSLYTAKLVRLGKPHRLRITHTWVKQDTKWRIICAMHDSCSELPACF